MPLPVALARLLRLWWQLLRLLIERGAVLDVLDKYHQTPAHWAAWNCHAQVLKVLFDSGADPNPRDTKRCTPLYNASFIGRQ